MYENKYSESNNKDKNKKKTKNKPESNSEKNALPLNEDTENTEQTVAAVETNDKPQPPVTSNKKVVAKPKGNPARKPKRR